MQSDESDMCRFEVNFKERVKIGPKTYFLGHFQKFFVYALLQLLSYTPIFCQGKVSWRYKMLVSFISIAFVVAKLCIFKGFPRSRKNMVGSGWFLGHNFPKWGPICTKFLPEIHCKAKNHLYYRFSSNRKNA